MIPKQAEVNIGMVGHVDHGKTTLTYALTGKWTDTFSEELKRGISIKLGYADVTFFKIKGREGPEAYTNKPCENCEVLRRVSFVDAPGHESLMATVISGAAIMDGALLVIAANEPCPRPQTIEHLQVLQIAGVENVVVAQNKVDLVSKEEARKHYEQIRRFLEGTPYEDAPVVPTAAHLRINIDALIQAIEEHIPTPKRDLSKPFRMYIARSFDVNKPGTPVQELVGGVIGGSIMQGKVRLDDEIEISPGIKIVEKGQERWEKLYTYVTSLHAERDRLDEAKPGGLIAIGTTLDPSLTKADGLVGNMVGKPGTLPEPKTEIEMEVHLIKRVVGKLSQVEVGPVKPQEPLVIAAGTNISIGQVSSVKGDVVTLKLKRPVLVEPGDKVVISRRIGGRWGLSGYGIVQ